MTQRRPLIIDNGRVREVPVGDLLDSSILNPVTRTIVPPGTLTIESIPLTSARSVKWIVTFSDMVDGKFKCSEVLALQDSAGQVHFTQYAIVGDRSIRGNIVVRGSSGNMIFEATNTGTHDITVDLVRVTTIPT